MSRKFLESCLYLSWLTGCFPAQSPFRKSKNFKFSWLHPITLISFLIILFDVALMTDFTVNNIESYAATTLGRGLSALIAETGCAFYIITGDAAIRLIAIFTCHRVIELIRLIDTQELLRQNRYKFCTYMIRCYITIIFATIINFTHQSLRINNFVNFLKPVPSYVHLTLVPHNDWVIRLVFWVQNVFVTASHSYGIAISLLLGTNLISLYAGSCNELNACWGNNCHNYHDFLGNPETYLERFVDRFKNLKKGFELYSAVAGPITLAVMFNTVMAFIHAVYSLSMMQSVSNIPGTIGCIFWIGFLSFFGNFMESKIKENREKLKDTLMAIPKKVAYEKVSCEELTKVTNWVISWKWKLTAGNLFSVNNSLLPAALGTSMTYVIYVFQLNMSETKSPSVVNPFNTTGPLEPSTISY